MCKWQSSAHCPQSNWGLEAPVKTEKRSHWPIGHRSGSKDHYSPNKHTGAGHWLLSSNVSATTEEWYSLWVASSWQHQREVCQGKVRNLGHLWHPFRTSQAHIITTIRITHRAESISRRRILGVEGTVAQEDDDIVDCADRKHDNSQLCHGTWFRNP